MIIRQKRVKLNYFTLELILQTGSILHIKCIKGIPAGSKFIRFIDNFACNQIELVIEHESFPPIKEGDLIPYLDDIIFEQIEK